MHLRSQKLQGLARAQQSRTRIAAPWRQRQQQTASRPRGAAAALLVVHAVPQHQQQQQQPHAPSSSSSSSPQPLADLALGGGRLASGLVQAITNPKEDKDLAKKRKEWQRKQDDEKAREQQQQEEQEQLQQQQQQQAAGEGLEAAVQEAVGEAEAAAVAAVADAAVAEGVVDTAGAGVPEALAAAGERSIVSEYTEELVEEAPKTLQQRVTDARSFLTGTNVGRGVTIAAGLFVGGTLLVALYRTWQKYSSPRAQRMRVIDKNKLLVAELSKFLPDNRAGLTPAVAKRLRGSTGFTPVEVFRKYLWFLLRERQFDGPAVQDMVLLKAVLGLGDQEVADALRERSQRIYDKYGTLMLNTDGMTPEGVERKATCRALFGKLLYLTEHEPLVAQDSDAFRVTDLRTIFGATDEDVENLRIVSLYEVDLDRMESLFGGSSGSGSSTGSGSDTAGQQQQQQSDDAPQGGSSSGQPGPEEKK